MSNGISGPMVHFIELLKHYGDASFACGDWNKHQDPEERYETLSDRCETARRAVTDWVMGFTAVDYGRSPRTFDQAFAEHNLTPDERQHLVDYLAFIRGRATIKALTPQRIELSARDRADLIGGLTT